MGVGAVVWARCPMRTVADMGERKMGCIWGRGTGDPRNDARTHARIVEVAKAKKDADMDVEVDAMVQYIVHT
jgi:hypothetical protein